MKKVLKWIGIVLGGLIGLLVIAVIGLALYASSKFKPTYANRPLYQITADTSPEGMALAAAGLACVAVVAGLLLSAFGFELHPGRGAAIAIPAGDGQNHTS